jgi:integrase
MGVLPGTPEEISLLQYSLGDEADMDPRGVAARGGHPSAPDGVNPFVELVDSFTSDRLAEHWVGGQPLRPDATVSGTINRFSPQDVPEELWQRVAPVVRDAVTKAPLNDHSLANKRMTIVTQLALWADQIGHPVDATSLFNPEFIDRFIAEGCAHLSQGTRLNYRGQLWRIGGAVVGHDLFPLRSVPLRRSDLVAPYSSDEVTELVSWSGGLPTSSMRRNSRALIALGLGTGMRAEEVLRAVGTDVREEDGVILVDVLGKGGHVDRVVPVHRLWAKDVLEIATDSGVRPFFRPERTRILRRDIINFVGRCSGDGSAKFNVQQLRVTWIVSHLAAGTYLSALEQAAGVTAVQLVKYLVFVAPLEVARARRLLVGEA